MTLFRNVLNYFETDKWKKILSYVVLGCFIIYLFCSISAFAQWFPGSTKYFVYYSTSGIVIRAFISILMVASGFLVWVTYRKKISLMWLFVFGLLILLNLLTVFVTPRQIYTLATQNILYPFLTSIEVNFGTYPLIINFFSYAVDILFGFMFMFVFPKCFNKKMFLIILSLFLCIILYSCLYSFVKEKNYYIKFLSGDWTYENFTIGSIFGDKQQWGGFLAITIPSVFVCWYMISKLAISKKIKVTFYVATSMLIVLTLFCSAVCFCKTAIICNALFLFIFFCNFIVTNFIKKKQIVLSIILLLILAVVILFFVLVAVVPELGSNPAFALIKKMLDALVDRGEQSVDDRASIFIAVFQNFPATNMFLGIPKGLLDDLIRGTLPELKNLLHTGYAIFAARSGVFGFSCYLILNVILIIYSIKVFKKSPFLSLTILGANLVTIILNLSELEILLMSSSMTVFISNIICVILPMSAKTIVEGYDYEEAII